MKATSPYLNKPLRSEAEARLPRWIVRTLEPNVFYAARGPSGIEWTKDRTKAIAFERWEAKTIHDDTSDTGRPCVQELVT